MENMLIQGTKSSPNVEFDAASGKIMMSGSSYPENASEFYHPLLNWIDKYTMEVSKEIKADFGFKYLNSSSVKLISEMVDKLNKLNSAGIPVEINWRCVRGDEDIFDLGEEFKEEVSCKFNIIED